MNKYLYLNFSNENTRRYYNGVKQSHKWNGMEEKQQNQTKINSKSKIKPIFFEMNNKKHKQTFKEIWRDVYKYMYAKRHRSTKQIKTEMLTHASVAWHFN